MPIEKRGSIKETDVRELVKMADANEGVLVVNLTSVLSNKEALAVIATGPRAATLRKLMEEVSA